VGIGSLNIYSATALPAGNTTIATATATKIGTGINSSARDTGTILGAAGITGVHIRAQ
tara:strand:- start:782 stop:955 length:174 start_codon:yes stop_codon:yes gene_type:complete